MPIQNKEDRNAYKREWYRRKRDGRKYCNTCKTMRQHVDDQCKVCRDADSAGLDQAINQFLYKGAA